MPGTGMPDSEEELMMMQMQMQMQIKMQMEMEAGKDPMKAIESNMLPLGTGAPADQAQLMQMQLQMQAQAGKNLAALPAAPEQAAAQPTPEAADSDGPAVDETLYA